jgi:hypothetical protein
MSFYLHYIYLCHLKYYHNNNKNIFKIGRTTQDNLKRFNNYPKGSILVYYSIYNDCYYIEEK